MSKKIGDLLLQARAQAEKTPQESSVTCASRAFADEESAAEKFEKLKQKLLQIKDWNEKSGISSYELFDADGSVAHRRQAIIGDFIRIALHGSGKYDWVKIINVDASADEIVLTVKPSYDPTEKEVDKSVTSHFFTSDATNNFCIEKKGAEINICVIGLSEKTNTSESGGVVETIRNAATANVGSYLGIQKAEWKKFCESFLQEVEKS